MSNPVPGWYADPSGLPGTFRWWDGQRWTVEITSDPSTPPPAAEEPGRRAPGQEQQHPPETGSRPEGSAQPSPQQTSPQQTGPQQPGPHQPDPTGSVPPPPGAPGPHYVPPQASPQASQQPPPWGAGSGGHPPGAEVLDSGHGGPGGPGTNRTALVVIVAIVGVLIVGGAATLIAVNSGDAEPAAASTTSPSPRPAVPAPKPKTPQPPSTDPAPGQTRTPTIPPPGVPTPGESVPTQPAGTAGLRYKPLKGKWRTDLQTSAILRGVGQIQVTEPRYDGQHNWVAMLAAGQTPAGTFDRDNLRESAKKLSTWFVSEGFTGTKVERRTLEAKPIKVDGHRAFLLKQHFSYSVPGLTSDGETVSLVVADLGQKGASRGGAFIASIPVTDKQLNADSEKALKTLHVVR